MKNISPQTPLSSRLVGISLAGLLIVAPFSTAIADESAYPGSFQYWQGAYGGLDLNVIAGGGEVDKGAGVKKFERYVASVLPGAHLGYNFSPFGGSNTGAWILGTEMDISFANLSSHKSDSVLGVVKLDSSFLASTRLRGGYAFDRLYLYATAGLALSDLNIKPQNNKDTDINVGVTIGLGAEYRFNDDWSMRLDARAYDFGDVKYKFNGIQRDVDRGLSKISLGISKKF